MAEILHNFTYWERGFRPFYRCYTTVQVDDRLRVVLPDYLHPEKIDVLLVYGYVNEKQRRCLQVVTTGHKEGDEVVFDPPMNDAFCTLLPEWLEDAVCDQVEDQKPLYKQYHEKYSQLERYRLSKDRELIRYSARVDPLRHEIYFDYLHVVLRKEDLKDEHIWVLGEAVAPVNPGVIWTGTVITEPKEQGFGVHAGDTIPFEEFALNPGQPFLLCDLDQDYMERLAKRFFDLFMKDVEDKEDKT